MVTSLQLTKPHHCQQQQQQQPPKSQQQQHRQQPPQHLQRGITLITLISNSRRAQLFVSNCD